MGLPFKPTPKIASLSQASILIYGQSKIGKSTWASNAPTPLFLDCEGGLKFLETYEYPIYTWDDILEAVHLLSHDKHNFETVVIDSIDKAYEKCTDYICNKLKIKHPADLSFGKAYKQISKEIMDVVTELALLPSGLIMISHSKHGEITSRRTEKTYHLAMPTLAQSISEQIQQFVDFIFYCDFRKNKNGEWERIIVTKNTGENIGGDRTANLPLYLPLDWNCLEEAIGLQPFLLKENKNADARTKSNTQTHKTTASSNKRRNENDLSHNKSNSKDDFTTKTKLDQ